LQIPGRRLPAEAIGNAIDVVVQTNIRRGEVPPKANGTAAAPQTTTPVVARVIVNW
jgi:hypothetical protein